jgi:hypothetical protein
MFAHAAGFAASASEKHGEDAYWYSSDKVACDESCSNLQRASSKASGDTCFGKPSEGPLRYSSDDLSAVADQDDCMWSDEEVFLGSAQICCYVSLS